MSKRTKKCPACGAQMPSNMRYCGWCGFDTREDLIDRVEMLPRPVRAPEAPRPVETSRWVDSEERVSRADRDMGSVWRMAAVIAAVVIIIIVAIVLVVQMNRPAERIEESETFESVHVINTDGEEITPTPTPDGNAAAAGEPTPTATPEPTPTPAPTPADTPEPTATPAVVTEVSDTVYVTGSGVNLRTGPSTTYDIIASLSHGTELSRTGTVDGWSRVVYNGTTGYISNALVSVEQPEATPTPAPESYAVTETDDTIVVASAANLRSGPGTGYDVVGTAAAGQELSRTGTTPGWSRVVVNGQEAFIYDGLITVKGAAAAATDTSATLTVVSRANLRSGPGTGYGIVGIAEVGETLDATDTSGSWYRIDYNGQTAYIFENLVTKN